MTTTAQDKVASAPANKVAKPRTTARPSMAKPVVNAAPPVATKAVAKAATARKPKAAVSADAKPVVKKLLKVKKLKMVRDSFAMPKLEYHALEELKLRSGMLGKSIKKSELIRAGIRALTSLSDTNFLAALKAVPTIKTGRPAKK